MGGCGGWGRCWWVLHACCALFLQQLGTALKVCSFCQELLEALPWTAGSCCWLECREDLCGVVVYRFAQEHILPANPPSSKGSASCDALQSSALGSTTRSKNAEKGPRQEENQAMHTKEKCRIPNGLILVPFPLSSLSHPWHTLQHPTTRRGSVGLWRAISSFRTFIRKPPALRGRSCC